jgi:hypothetical protein
VALQLAESLVLTLSTGYMGIMVGVLVSADNPPGGATESISSSRPHQLNGVCISQVTRWFCVDLAPGFGFVQDFVQDDVHVYVQSRLDIQAEHNWRAIRGGGHGVRLVPKGGRVGFDIVERESGHSAGTVKDGDGLCPFPDCRRTIDGDEIKAQARAGRMDHQMYCVVYKEERIKGYTKNGKPKIEKVRAFRAPRPADDVEALGLRPHEKRL